MTLKIKWMPPPLNGETNDSLMKSHLLIPVFS